MASNNRAQNILESFSRCKMEFVKEKEDNKKLREINAKLELELRESRDAEKSHRCHLAATREMIGNLQDTVSHLVYLKRDVQKLNDDLVSKEAIILGLQKDKDDMTKKHNATVEELRMAHEKHIEALTIDNERKLRKIQEDFETSAAQMSYTLEELRALNKEKETSYNEKAMALECEEKIQRSEASVTQLQGQLSHQAARTDASIEVYRRRLQVLEEKLKHREFEYYLPQTAYPSQSPAERVYSADATQNTHPSPGQVTYYGNNMPNAQRNEKEKLFLLRKSGSSKCNDF